MAPDTEPPIVPQSEPPKSLKQILRLAWDSFWEFCGLSKFGNHLLVEIVHVKNAPTLLILLLISPFFLLENGREKERVIDELRGDKANLWADVGRWQSSDKTNTALLGQYQLEVRQLTSKLQDANREKDKTELQAQEAQHSLAQWILLANSGNTNTPLTERLDDMTKAWKETTISLGRAVNDLIAEKPSFSVSFGDGILNLMGPDSSTNNPIQFFQLGTNRQIRITVRNVGGTSADNLTVQLVAPLPEDALTSYPRWNTRITEVGMSYHAWEVTSHATIPSESVLDLPILTVSTNATNAVNISIGVFSSNSRLHKYFVGLLQ